MGRNALRITADLARDRLAAVPEPARHAHALPGAEDRGPVAVAKAQSDGTQAYDAVLAALGLESSVVGLDPWTMDAPTARSWGVAARCCPPLQICAFPDPLSDALWGYAQALAALLGARLDHMTTAGQMNALMKEVGRGDGRLFIFGKGSHPLVRRLLAPSTADEAPFSHQDARGNGVLVAQEPRWPLERILLVIRGASADSLAVDWTLRLACPSGATVNVLAVVPPVPVMYHGLSRMEQTLRSLLRTDTALGHQMRQATRRLAASMVDCVLRLRKGALDLEICHEMGEGDYDLVVMATRPCRWWLRQLKGDPVCSLLSCAGRPALFVKPTTA